MPRHTGDQQESILSTRMFIVSEKRQIQFPFSWVQPYDYPIASEPTLKYVGKNITYSGVLNIQTHMTYSMG